MNKAKLRIDKFDNSDERIEAEANYFALALLMPERQFVHWYQVIKNLQYSIYSTEPIGALATIFGVGRVHVELRLKSLEL